MEHIEAAGSYGSILVVKVTQGVLADGRVDKIERGGQPLYQVEQAGMNLGKWMEEGEEAT